MKAAAIAAAAAMSLVALQACAAEGQGPQAAAANMTMTSPKVRDVGTGAVMLEAAHAVPLMSSPSARDVGTGAVQLNPAHAVMVGQGEPVYMPNASEAPVQSAASMPGSHPGVVPAPAYARSGHNLGQGG